MNQTVFLLYLEIWFLQTSYVFHQFALEVGCFILVNAVVLCQSVDHADHLGQKHSSFLLVCDFPQVFDRSSG